MFKNHSQSLYELRHKVYSIINISGLAACWVLIFLFVPDELSL